MQSSKVYVGNSDYSVINEQLEGLFSNCGEVRHVNIIEGRAFGFVQMSNQSEAEVAREALDGSDFKGRTLRVNEESTGKGLSKVLGQLRVKPN